MPELGNRLNIICLESSEILEDYYLGQGQILQNNRFHIYAEALDLGWNGTEFTNLSTLKPILINDIQSAAALFVGIGVKNVGYLELIKASTTILALTLNTSAEKHLDRYLESLKKRIQDED